MNAEERLTKLQELNSKILYLKANPTVDSKKTIQKLQQQKSDISYE